MLKITRFVIGLSLFLGTSLNITQTYHIIMNSIDLKSAINVTEASEAFGISRQTLYKYISAYENEGEVSNDLIIDLFDKITDGHLTKSNMDGYLVLVKQYTELSDGTDPSRSINDLVKERKKLQGNLNDLDRRTDDNLENKELQNERIELEHRISEINNEIQQKEHLRDTLDGLRLSIRSYGSSDILSETFRIDFDYAKGPTIIGSPERKMVIFNGSYEDCSRIKVVLYIEREDSMVEIGMYPVIPDRKFALIDDIVPGPKYHIAARKRINDTECRTSQTYPLTEKNRHKLGVNPETQRKIIQ